MPVEIAAPIRFTEGQVHRAYDPDYANRFWRILIQVRAVLGAEHAASSVSAAPCISSGAVSIWRSPGFPAARRRRREGPAFMREAYSHEVISHGFWPGGGPVREPVFYAYAAPEPSGFKEAAVEPKGAYYHRDLGEFLYPYERARAEEDTDAALRRFIQSTYRQGATLGGWDPSLDRT